MSGIVFTLSTGEVALVAATVKTVLQAVAPTNQRQKILGWGVYFDGTSPAGEPVIVEMVRQSTAGTMTALSAVKVSPGSETVQSTAQHTATVEPTLTDVIFRKEVHPQSGYEMTFPLGQEIPNVGGGRIGIRCTAPAGVNCVASLTIEE